MATRKEIRLYGDLVHQHKITFKTMLWELLLGYFKRKHGAKESIYEDNASFPPPVDHLRELPLKYLAIVNNKKVLELIRLDENTAEFIQKRGSKLVPFDPRVDVVKKGMSYIDNKFMDGIRDSQNETD